MKIDMKNEIYKCNEKENELNVLNNKLQSSMNWYKIVMDENDQKIENKRF